MKILVVVDDEPDIRFVVETLLQQDPRLEIGAQAQSAEEAFEVCGTLEPGLIILDHILGSGLTGIEAAPRLKELAPNSKILLFSAHLVAEAASSPAIDGFLSKHDVGKLLPAVQGLLGLPPLEPA